jgi:hypothetical protein
MPELSWNELGWTQKNLAEQNSAEFWCSVFWFRICSWNSHLHNHWTNTRDRGWGSLFSGVLFFTSCIWSCFLPCFCFVFALGVGKRGMNWAYFLFFWCYFGVGEFAAFMLFIWRISLNLRFVCGCCWWVFCRGCIGWPGVRKARSGRLCGLFFPAIMMLYVIFKGIYWIFHPWFKNMDWTLYA